MTRTPAYPAVVSWLKQYYAEVHRGSSVSVHLDELGSRVDVDPLDAYGDVVTALTPSALLRVMPVLVLPLPHSEQLDTRPVVWSNSLVESSTEPPSICLVARETLGMLDVVEEYRCPVPSPDLPPLEGQYFAYYRCSRSSRAIREGWEEYERAVCIEAYPKQLILPD